MIDKKMVRKIVIILVFLGLPALTFASNEGESKKELFSLANLAFADGRYDEAISSYNKIIQLGLINPDIYYNLGNAYLKKGERGKALLYYEKSLRLVENDDDVMYNRTLVREQMSLAPDGVSLDAPWHKALLLFNFRQSAGVTFLFYFSTFFVLFLMFFLAGEDVRNKLKKAAIIFTCLTLTGGALSMIKLYQQERDDKCIVVAAKADIYDMPLDNAAPLGTIPEGLTLTLLEKDNDWFKVSAPKGMVGWIKKDVAGII